MLELYTRAVTCLGGQGMSRKGFGKSAYPTVHGYPLMLRHCQIQYGPRFGSLTGILLVWKVLPGYSLWSLAWKKCLILPLHIFEILWVCSTLTEYLPILWSKVYGQGVHFRSRLTSHQMSPRQQQRDLAARLVSAFFPSGWSSRWANFFWFPVCSVVYTSRHPAGNQKPLLGGQSEGLRGNIFLALSDSLCLSYLVGLIG